MRHVAVIARALLCVACVLAPARAFAEFGFPDYIKFPRQIGLAEGQNIIKETLAEAEFAVDASGTAKEVRKGQHFARWLFYKPAPGEPATGFYNGSEERIFNAVHGALAGRGWKDVFVSEEKTEFVMRLNEVGKDIWVAVKMDAPQAQVFYEVIEVGGAANPLALKPPAAQPEKIAANQDFPYLPPYPGSKAKGGDRSLGPLNVSPPSAGDNLQLVGSATLTRTYDGPKTLSQLQFISDYAEALRAAGWTVLFPDADAMRDSGILIAHYARNNRDVWARLTYEYGANLWYQVADIGAEDWAARFDKECRLPLYGVFFDFNKATLRPESDSVLTKAAALLKGKPFPVEVQGHTDGVGSDDYNDKLSAARAASVRDWLAAHAVDAARLTARGYGKSRPVADNGSDEGRAKNRRVELVKPGCKR